MIENHLDFGLLEYAGAKIFNEYKPLKKALHFEIPLKYNVVFLDVVKGFEAYGKGRSIYYFGTFKEPFLKDGITERKLAEFNKQIWAIERPENKRKANELNNLLLSVFFEGGYKRLVENYYKEFWPIESIP